MKPSIGRIVLYNHPGSADGRFDPHQSAAIIRGHPHPDDTVDLVVFSSYGVMWQQHVAQGNGPSQWQWPERIDS